VPHFHVHVSEHTLDGTVEPKMIRALTDAVVDVYGERARDLAVVEIFRVPPGRWGRAGEPVTDGTAAQVTLNMREVALTRPDVEDAPRRLIAAITDAVAGVFDDSIRAQLNVVIVGIPQGRSGVAGEIV
jgi:phenylpyruvate tautomerase PptA (4-oxalocrotonate tautomerase family)